MTVAFDQDSVTAKGTIYPDDCDHMGHMNVAAYTRKYDEGTWALWTSVGFGGQRMLQEGLGLAAMESRVTYHREFFPGESYVIRSRFLCIKPRVARFYHRIYKLVDSGMALEEELAGTCTYTVACLDRSAHKAVPFPEDIAARISVDLRPLPEEAEAS
jgi:acyl-CoA thioester hydrolase